MILVLGNKGCSRCEMVKKVLEKNNIKFEYKLLDDCDNKQDYINIAVEKGMLNLPLVFKNGEIIDFEEVLK